MLFFIFVHLTYYYFLYVIHPILLIFIHLVPTWQRHFSSFFLFSYIICKGTIRLVFFPLNFVIERKCTLKATQKQYFILQRNKKQTCISISLDRHHFSGGYSPAPKKNSLKPNVLMWIFCFVCSLDIFSWSWCSGWCRCVSSCVLIQLAGFDFVFHVYLKLRRNVRYMLLISGLQAATQVKKGNQVWNMWCVCVKRM